MIPKDQLGAARAWAAHQWVVKGRAQRQIGRDLGISEASAASAVNTLITEFLAGVHPELARGEYNGRPYFGMSTGGRQELLRAHFGNFAPLRPACVKERPPVWWPARNREALQRVRDPDEAWAPRDVWLTYMPGPHGFDWMEPVT